MSTRWTLDDINRKGLKTDVSAGGRDFGKTSKTLPLLSGLKGKGVEDNLVESPKRAYQALGRLPAGTTNATEQKYAHRLKMLEHAGEILWWAFEPANLRLADKCFYKVDFLVMTQAMALEVHEVKGFWTDDALVKIKVAANKFPFRFLAVQLIKGEWVEREF